MNTNSLVMLAAVDRHHRPIARRCKCCGSTISTYNANPSLVALRPEAVNWDWWAACDNADCEHAYGEGYFQDPLDWIDRRPVSS
jgi:hypothetical protein